MKLGKTDIAVLKLVVRNIDIEYSIKEIADNLKRPYVKVYQSVQKLLENKVLSRKVLGKSHYCKINYKRNLGIICFIESIRAGEFLDKNKEIKLLIENILNELSIPIYSLVIFGSYAQGTNKKNSDLDLALITSKKDLKKTEKVINNILRITSIKVHSVELTFSDFINMLKSKDITVGKEIMKNHIFVHGCEQLYECKKLSE